MTVVRAKVGEDVLFHKGPRVFFRLQASPAGPGEVHLDLQRPMEAEDGGDTCLDSLERRTIPIGETLELEFEGLDGRTPFIENFDITVAAIEAGAVSFQLALPDRWGALADSAAER
jgi:hypothetical protein